MNQLEMEIVDGTLIAALSGEIDHHSASGIRKDIDATMEHYRVRNLIMDYSGVSFMDSSGIGLVLGRYKRVRKWNGTLVVIPGSSYISRVLGLSGIFGMVPKSRNRSLALEYITARGGIRS